MCGLVIFIDVTWTRNYLLKEAGVLKHSWTNYAIALDNCYLFTKNYYGIEHDIDSTYGDIRHWAIPGKKQTEWVNDMEFPGVLKKYQVEYPGVKLNKHRIFRVDQ